MREYIGSRYVPKFMGMYDVTQTYEALCVVDNGQGTSYITRKPTPAGTPLTDSDYWFIYGASSGAIINLQNQIDDINDEIDNNVIKRHKYAIITDSYGISMETGGTSFPELFKTYMGLTTGVDFCWKYIAGAGFVANTVHFTDVIDALYENMPSTMVPSDITDLIIAGGANDSSITNHSQLQTAIENTIAYAKNKFPNAKIYIAPIAGLGGIVRKRNIFNNVVPYYLDCERFGAFPLHNVQYVMCKKSLFYETVDPTHPNQNGQVAIAEALAAAITKGYNHIEYNVPFAFTPTDPYTITVTSANANVNNDQITIELSGVRLNMSDIVVMSNPFKIADFTNDYVYGNNMNYEVRINCAFGSGAGRHDVPIIFSNGSLYVSFKEDTVATQIVEVSAISITTRLSNI